MLFKKFTAVALSAAIAVSMSAGVGKVYANEVSDQYFNELSKISTWGKATSKDTTQINYSVNSTKNPTENTSGGYTIDTTSMADSKTFDQYVSMQAKNSGSAPAIPEIQLYFNKDGKIFVNKSLADFAIKKTSLTQQTFNTDFVEVKSKSFSESYKNAVKSMSSNSESKNKAIEFLKGLDLGKVDLGLTKDGNTYTMKMNADQIVDLMNSYIKSIYKNPDTMLKLYKEGFGIDLAKVSNVSEEEMKKSMAQAYDMWVKTVEPKLPIVKTLLNGSSIETKEVFDQDAKTYTAQSDIKLKLNIYDNMYALLSDEATKDIKLGNVDETLSLTIKSNSTTKAVDKLDLNIPTNADAYDLDAALNAKQEEMKKQAEAMSKITYSVNLKTNKLVLMTGNGNTMDFDLKAELKNGTLMVDAATFNSLTGIETNTSEKMVSFKDVMTTAGYTVTWDSSAKTATATK